MRKPKTVRGFLKIAMQFADLDPSSLKGVDKLTEEQRQYLWYILVGVQNDLGEDPNGVMEKFNLEWH